MTSQQATLGEVAEFIRGITFKPADLVEPGSDGSVVCMRTKNIQEDLETQDLIAVPKSLVKRTHLYLKEGDILISSANSWELVGKCCWVPALSYSATAGGFISVLRASEAKVTPRFLYHWLASAETQHRLRHCGRQTTNISNLNHELAKQIPLTLPPLPEQRRIAAILDKADAIRRKREEGIRLTEELLRSTFLEMFGDPTANTHEWPLVPIANYGKITTGNTPSRKNPDYYGDEIEWIKSDNLVPSLYVATTAAERLSPAGRRVARIVPKGSVLVTCIAGSLRCIGNASIVDREVAFNQQINAITPRANVDSHFLLGLIQFSQKSVQAASTESMKGLVSKSKFEGVKVPLIPLEEQQVFGNFFRTLAKGFCNRMDAFKQSSDLFETLVDRAFRGEL